ncbi:uncharacterized protein LOC129571956 isoform X4 [Sitodiplosis mosellana]|uniref:uncharacterized protein LOC129571956 isoform X4 n=1 Tax=Sitodiplosis mosellana TaxID=263140 RepID=UPI002443E818|nr:uncharacterized protein LOC129571956 isoform X4 [Sitodiplosis mosellana]
MYKLENSKPKFCIGYTLTAKAMNYLTILFSIVFIAFTVYVQFSRYIFMHNFATESQFEMYAFQAVCVCYVFLVTFYFFILISYKAIREAIEIDTSGNPLLYASYTVNYSFNQNVTSIMTGFLMFAIVLGQSIFYVVHFHSKFFPEFITVGYVLFVFNIWTIVCWFRGIVHKQIYLWPLILWAIFLCVWFWAISVLTYSKSWNRGNIKALIMFYVLTVPILAIYFMAFMSYTLAKRAAQHLNQRHQLPETFYPKREPNNSNKNHSVKRNQTKPQKSPI